MENLENKRESGMSRVVGVEEYVEQELLDYFKKQFEKDGPRHNLEQEHTRELDELISQVNEKMHEFMVRYGLKSLEIPERNIHLVDKSKLNPQQLEQLKQRVEEANGIYVPTSQHIGMFINYKTNNKLKFAKTLVHEMMHANAFNSAQKVKEGGLKFTKGEETMHIGERRMGFEIKSAKTAASFFRDINEAITEELTIRFDHNYFSECHDLKQEYEERQKAIEVIAKNSGKDKKDIEKTIAHLESSNLEGVRYAAISYSYHHERELLNKLINDLYQNNSSEFKSPEDVFTLFAKAALDGRLLPIARLIEKTYSKGSFRKLGEETFKIIR